GMRPLDRFLREAGPVATDLIEVENRGVAGVSDQNGAQSAIRALNRENGNVMIHRPRTAAAIGIRATSVHRDACEALPEFQSSGSQIVQGRAYDPYRLAGQKRRIPVDRLPFLLFQVENR